MSKINEQYFLEGYPRVFPNETLTKGKADAMINLIRMANESEYVQRLSHYAFHLGNSKHESNNTYLPVPEGYWIKPEDRRIRVIRAYYTTGKGKKHNKTICYKDKTFYGRGAICQTTHDYNYLKASQKIFGDDRLFQNPDLVLQPDIDSLIAFRGAAEGWFVPGQRLDRWLNDNGMDFYNSRRIINGTDHATDISIYCAKFFKILIFE